MKKASMDSRIVMVGIFAVLGFGMVFSIFGLSRMVANIDDVVISREPEAILASAGVESGANISLPVVYYDQKQDDCVNIYDAGASKELKNRQFEWTSCGYMMRQIEQGLVDFDLGEDYLPVAVGGKAIPNKSLEKMDRWFKAIEGKSKEYAGTIELKYRTNETTEFSFVNNDFYPLDAADFSAGDAVNKDGHNHLWTMNFAVPFTVVGNGEESFEITADDDTFVYVGSKLVIDMGGIHDSTIGKMAIKEDGEIYTTVNGEEMAYSGVQLNEKESSIIRIFHADRDAGDGSVLKIKLIGMNPNVVQTQLANGANGVQVAYDPADPSFVKPLGESTVIQPDGVRGFMIVAIIMGVMVVTFAVLMTILAHKVVKRNIKK